jgi:hypothetical protein
MIFQAAMSFHDFFHLKRKNMPRGAKGTIDLDYFRNEMKAEILQ